MKITIDTHLSDNQLTGIGRYLNCLLNELTSLDSDSKFELLTFPGLGDSHPVSQITGPNINQIPINVRGPSPKQHFITPRLLWQSNPDVYHHPHFDLPMGHNVPSVVTIHDLKYIRHPEFFPELSWLKRVYMRMMIQQSLDRAKKIISVSQATKDDLLSLFNVNEDKICVIPHGVTQTENSVSEKNDDALLRFGIEKPYILFVGERRPHKNLVRLVQAFKVLNDRVKGQVGLVIAGKTYKDYDAPEKTAVQCGIQEKVVFTDYVTDAELESLYKQASMLILPSLYEGFGLPLLEAMKRSIPVLGSNCTSIPEVIEDAGLLFDATSLDDMADKMERILFDFEFANSLAQKGKERSQLFSWKTTAQMTYDVYTEIA